MIFSFAVTNTSQTPISMSRQFTELEIRRSMIFQAKVKELSDLDKHH
jgi:hypothetical protein